MYLILTKDQHPSGITTERRDVALDPLERGNEVVSRAAMAAYRRSHFPGKARLLKRLALSRNPRAFSFASRGTCDS